MRRFLATILAVTLLQAAAPRPAAAHPHVWVDALTFLEFEDGRLASIRLEWAFDEFFSEILYQDFDWNDNRVFDEDELEAMRDGAFLGLGEVNFFTDLRIDGQQVSWEGAQDFGVSVSEDGRVVSYSFTLNVPEPADPFANQVSLSLYDPEFYVAVDFREEDPLRVRGLQNGACDFSLAQAEDNPIYFGLVYPIRAEFRCEEVTG